MCFIKILIVYTVPLIILLGCSEAKYFVKGNSSLTGDDAFGVDDPSGEEVNPPLPDATEEEIDEFATECPDDDSQDDIDDQSKDKVCVLICHVPTGNPEGKHTLTIPTPALLAHIDEHGPDEGVKDHLGECI